MAPFIKQKQPLAKPDIVTSIPSP